MLMYRAGHVVYSASSGGKVKHPWEGLLKRESVLSEGCVKAVSEVIVILIRVFSNIIVRVALVERFSVSLRVLVGAWVVGAYVDDVYLVLVCGVCVAFVGPVWYKKNQAWCDDVIERRLGKSKED